MLRNHLMTCEFLLVTALRSSTEIGRANTASGSTINGEFVFAGTPATPTKLKLWTIIEAHPCHDENRPRSIQARSFWKNS